MTDALPPGWTTQPVILLDPPVCVGDRFFRHGVRPQIRAAPGSLLLIANELGDIHAYADVLTQPRRILVQVEDPVTGKAAPLSRSSFPGPGHYRYAAVLPAPQGTDAPWSLLLSLAQFARTELAGGLPGADPIRFAPRQQILAQAGYPETIDWQRDGWRHLLLGTATGQIIRLPRQRTADKVAFDTAPQPVRAGESVLELPAPVCPCVVDWNGTGRHDLLVGDGWGRVILFRDVGGPDEVRYDRGQELLSSAGVVRVSGPASATVLQVNGTRHLLVADGVGAITRWPLRTVSSLVATDLPGAVAAQTSAFSSTYTPAKWRPFDAAGPLLTAAPQTCPPDKLDRHRVARFDPPAPEIAIDLPARGLHEIHVTLRQPPGWHWRQRVIARLSDEKTGQILSGGELHTLPRQEIFYRVADLQGQKLHLRQLVGALQAEGGFPVFVESVRLVPVPRIVADPVQAKPLRTAAIFDAFMWVHHYQTNSDAAMAEVVEWHRRSGFDILYYKLGGAGWEYPSRVPGAQSVRRPQIPEFNEAERDYCERVADVWESFDRVGAAARACNERGMQLFAWLRIQNENEHIVGRFPFSQFYLDHPEWYEKDINGNPVRGKMCLEFAPVRKFLIDLAMEGLEKGAAGVMIDTLRHLPKVMYGDPVREIFQREHGVDMRSLPPFDPRVVELQTRVMTQFLRELKAAMQKVRPGAELHVRVCRPDPLMGVHPRQWAEEGIVDAIIIEDRISVGRPDLAGLVQTVAGTRCAPGYAFAREWWKSESGVPLHPLRVEEEMAWARAEGATIAAFYESAEIINRPELGRAIRRLKDERESSSRAILPIEPKR